MSYNQGLYRNSDNGKIELRLDAESFGVDTTTGVVSVIGGGGSGEDFSDDIAELNRKMDFFYKEKPALTPASTNKKKGTTASVSLTATVTVNGTAIVPESLRLKGSDGVFDQTVSPTGTSSTFSVTGITKDTTYSLYVNGSATAGATASVKFFNPAYYGIVPASFVPSPDSIGALTELTNYGTSRYQPAKISGRTGTEKICYAYPSSLGALTAITDVDGGNWINSFTTGTVTLNGETYRYYVLTDPADLNGIDYGFGESKADNK